MVSSIAASVGPLTRRSVNVGVGRIGVQRGLDPPLMISTTGTSAPATYSHFVPAAPGCLYIRPVVMGVDAALGVKSSSSFVFFIITLPSGPYFKDAGEGPGSIDVLVTKSTVRSAPGMMGSVKAGANYGWPIVSDGDNYDKSPIPDHRTRPEFTAPVKTWTPVISPSGAMFYGGSLFPWKGNLVLGGLSAKGLVRLRLDGGKVASEDRLDLQRRIRDVIEAPDGAVLVITDERAGALLRLTPSTSTR